MNIEGLLRAALEASDEGIVATNAEWRVVLWNRGAARMFGWTAAEALGRPAFELHMRDVDPRELARCSAELRSGIGLGILDVPKMVEAVLVFDQYRFDVPLDAQLFEGRSE